MTPRQSGYLDGDLLARREVSCIYGSHCPACIIDRTVAPSLRYEISTPSPRESAGARVLSTSSYWILLTVEVPTRISFAWAHVGFSIISENSILEPCRLQAYTRKASLRHGFARRGGGDSRGVRPDFMMGSCRRSLIWTLWVA
jgi:hypothetical protein